MCAQGEGLVPDGWILTTGEDGSTAEFTAVLTARPLANVVFDLFSSDLGEGMPSSLSGQITSGGTAKGFSQSSTGTILSIQSITPNSLESGTTGWKTEAIP